MKTPTKAIRTAGIFSILLVLMVNLFTVSATDGPAESLRLSSTQSDSSLSPYTLDTLSLSEVLAEAHNGSAFPTVMFESTKPQRGSVEAFTYADPDSIYKSMPYEWFTQDRIDDICEIIAETYSNVDANVLKSVIYHESRYNYLADNSSNTCHGLMQINPYWQKARMKELGLDDIYHPYQNVRLGAAILDDLLQNNGNDIHLALMLYNMNHDTARRLYNSGHISEYARSVVDRAEQIAKGGV